MEPADSAPKPSLQAFTSHFWQPLKFWWYATVQRHGKRPTNDEIARWYNKYGANEWKQSQPTLEQVLETADGFQVQGLAPQGISAKPTRQPVDKAAKPSHARRAGISSRPPGAPVKAQQEDLSLGGAASGQVPDRSHPPPIKARSLPALSVTAENQGPAGSDPAAACPPPHDAMGPCRSPTAPSSHSWDQAHSRSPSHAATTLSGSLLLQPEASSQAPSLSLSPGASVGGLPHPTCAAAAAAECDKAAGEAPSPSILSVVSSWARPPPVAAARSPLVQGDSCRMGSSGGSLSLLAYQSSLGSADAASEGWLPSDHSGRPAHESAAGPPPCPPSAAGKLVSAASTDAAGVCGQKRQRSSSAAARLRPSLDGARRAVSAGTWYLPAADAGPGPADSTGKRRKSSLTVQLGAALGASLEDVHLEPSRSSPLPAATTELDTCRWGPVTTYSGQGGVQAKVCKQRQPHRGGSGGLQTQVGSGCGAVRGAQAAGVWAPPPAVDGAMDQGSGFCGSEAADLAAAAMYAAAAIAAVSACSEESQQDVRWHGSGGGPCQGAFNHQQQQAWGWDSSAAGAGLTPSSGDDGTAAQQQHQHQQQHQPSSDGGVLDSCESSEEFDLMNLLSTIVDGHGPGWLPGRSSSSPSMRQLQQHPHEQQQQQQQQQQCLQQFQQQYQHQQQLPPGSGHCEAPLRGPWSSCPNPYAAAAVQQQPGQGSQAAQHQFRPQAHDRQPLKGSSTWGGGGTRAPPLQQQQHGTAAAAFADADVEHVSLSPVGQGACMLLDDGGLDDEIAQLLDLVD